jgi:glucokinase
VNGWVLAIDVGGTKLAAARVRGDGSLDRRRQRPTRSGVTADELWADLLALVDDVTDGDAPPAVGVGCGGPMQWPEGLVSPLNIAAWRGFPLRQRLKDRFATADVVVHNDAVAMALGEHRFGAGRDSVAFLGVVVSTGVGGGLVIDGRLVSGRTGNAGHFGHVVVDAAGPPCRCGGNGCVEAIARGPALVTWALEQGWQPRDDEDVDGRALVAAARHGDDVALASLTRGGHALGVALASVAAVMDLDTVAIGGGVANAGELLLGPVQAAYHRHARLDFTRGCRIVPAALGDDAGLVGAAALVLPSPRGGAD